MQDSSSPQSMQKYFLIAGVALAALLLAMIVWISMGKSRVMDEKTRRKPLMETTEQEDRDEQNEDRNGREREQDDGADEKEATPGQSVMEPEEQQPTHTASRVTFDTVSLPPSPPRTPATVTLYRFSAYDSGDVDRVASVLGLTQRKTENGATIAYNTVDPSSRGWLMIDGARGALTYRYYGETPQETSGTTATARAQTFLRQAGLIDDLVDCDITYQKTTMPDVTMVECHRDWVRTGLPIVNFIGLVNIPEGTSFASMQVGRSYEGLPDDPSVVNTSTGQDGFSRPSDFNTATVSIHRDGRILGFTSNIRQIVGTQQIAAADLVSADEVRQKIVRGETEMFFIRPQGNGVVDWSSFFSTTRGSGAQVTDLILSYVEIPGRQEYLAPMYLARGTAQLGSYPAVFFAAHPATQLGVSAGTRSGSVAGVSDSRYLAQSPFQSPFQSPMGDSPKLSTFGFIPAATVDGTPHGECLPSVGDLYPLIALPPFGQIGQFSKNNTGNRRANNWYLIPSNPAALPEINAVVAMFDTLGLQGKTAEVREMDNLQKEWAKYNNCPLRMSGSSPTIFVFGSSGTRVNIRPQVAMIYREPAASNAGAWDVTVLADGSLQVNNRSVPYLYYEYSPVSFTRPENGWNVRRSELMTFAQETIAPALDLSEIEADRLAYEIATAAFGMTDETVYLAPIAQSAVDAKLPLEVSGAGHIVRTHFYVGAAQPGATAPQLSPIARNQPMILELGAMQGK